MAKRTLSNEEREVVEHALGEFGGIYPEAWRKSIRVCGALGCAYRHVSSRGGDYYGSLSLRELKALKEEVSLGMVEIYY